MVHPADIQDRDGGVLVMASLLGDRKALAFLRLASIRLMLRKLCNPK